MQKMIRFHMVLLFLLCVNHIIAADMLMPIDTTIKTLVTLKEYPITNLASTPSIKKDDPEIYYGKWQWVSNDQDTFTINIEPNKGQLDKEGKTIKADADVICNYSIVRQGKLMYVDSGKSKELILYGFSAQKSMLLAPVECKMENLDQSCFFVFRFVSDKNDIANLNKGSQLPFFAKVFDKQPNNTGETISADLVMKKVSGTY